MTQVVYHGINQWLELSFLAAVRYFVILTLDTHYPDWLRPDTDLVTWPVSRPVWRHQTNGPLPRAAYVSQLSGLIFRLNQSFNLSFRIGTLLKFIYLNVALLYGMHFQILGHRILCAGFDKTPLICCNVLQAFLKAPVFLHLPGYPVAGAGNITMNASLSPHLDRQCPIETGPVLTASNKKTSDMMLCHSIANKHSNIIRISVNQCLTCPILKPQSQSVPLSSRLRV